MIRTRKAPARFLSALLCLVMMLTLLPTVALAAPGDTADNPVVCTTFAEFKAAMESTTVTYVKLNGVSGSNGEMLTQASFAAGISNTTYKVLTIEGTNTFYSPLNGRNDCLIWPRSELTINGTGTLKYEHGNTGGTGAVINMASNVPLTINGNVTLEGGANGTSFGYAIFAQAGTTTINGGSFIGYDAMIADSVDMSAVSISSSANLTINGGNFSASLHLSSPAGKKAHSLSITSTATGTISIKEGTFPQGINIKATGKTIRTCGYFDTAKASITAGGITVEATAGTDFLKSTEVIVTDTASSTEPTKIDSVDVKITEPVAGAHPQDAVSNTANVSVSITVWYHNGTKMSASDTFAAGETYKVHVIVYPDSGYEFADNPTATFNGSKTGTLFTNGKDYINYYVEFTAANAPIDSVDVTITEPVAGAEPQDAVSNTANVSVSTTEWYHNGTKMSASDTFAAGETYKVHVIVYPDSGYKFADNPTVTFNGSKTGTLYLNGKDFINYYAEFTATAASTEYTITVINGKATVGAGTEISKAAEGTTVTLTANAAPTDKVFDKWEVVSGSITLADANSATTTFVMPAGAVSVKATYKEKPVTTYAVTVNSGTGSGNFAAGATVSITANEPATGKVFDQWTTSDGVTFANENSANTTFVMPAKAVTVTATYKDAPVDPDPEKPVDPDPEKFSYKIIKGANGKWDKTSKAGLEFISNGDFDKFEEVKVDGKTIDKKHYSAKAGSTIVTLKDSLLSTLGKGDHSLTLVFEDGKVETKFTILEKETLPKTGGAVYPTMLFGFILLLAGVFMYRRREA